MGYRIECVLQCENHLGEGPVWDVDTGVLWWLDGTGRRVGNPSIWRLDPRTNSVSNWSLDHDVGALAVQKNGKLVLALSDGFYLFNPDNEDLELITLIEADQPRSRLNDGKVDRRGRFVAGGMDDKEELAICGLWQLDPNFNVTRIEDGIICTNGPCWSPDDKTFFVADTFVDEFWAYDYDIETGKVSNKRVFASTKDVSGVPDGSTVDAEGCLWNAELISGDLVRYDPEGTVERKISMPVSNITSVMFGGNNLDEIYVTSMARVKHPAVHERFRVDAKPQFGAGSLFRVTGLGIHGIPEPRFAG